MENFLWVIPAAPLAAFIFTLLFGQSLLKERAHWPGIIGVGASFVFSVITFFQVQGLNAGEALNNHLFTWMNTGQYDFDKFQVKVPITLRADHLTALMLLVVTSVGLLAHIYSVGLITVAVALSL